MTTSPAEPAIVHVTDAQWRAFVAGHPDAMPFHHPDWASLVAECYGFHAFAVVAADATGTIAAGIPLVEVRHLRSRPKWVALPFTDFCPPLVTDGGPDLAAALTTAARSAGVRRIEVRAPLAGATTQEPVAVKHVLRLDADPARTFDRFHRSQVHRNIKRAEREGLTVRQADRREDLLDTFYGLHLRTRHRQGVPVQPRRFFRLLWDRAISTGLGSVLVVEAAGQPVAAAVFLSWNGTVIYKFGASDQRFWSLRPNHLLFWHAIRAACERGDQWFDFGRTDLGNEGLRAFKGSWGAREEQLDYSALGTPSRSAAQSDGLATRALGTVIRRGPALLCRATGEVLYRYVA
jgi:CelD/BcsL family acetyltransferase involved in cellulose biosynthesis